MLSIIPNTPSQEPRTFLELINEFNRVDAIENDHSEETQYKYINIAANFGRYLSATGQANLLVTELTMPILKYFVLWLPENLKSCNRTHLSKHVYRINKAADYCVQMGLIPYNPCAAFKIKRGKTKPVINLEDTEFISWVTAKWANPIYQKAQDLYIFQMTAGLSYMDLFIYKTTIDPTGIWIEGTRGKGRNKKPYAVPLYHPDFSMALAIHNKYNGKLPFIENHFYNRLIREMAAQLGIEKYLTSHTGRKTFACLKDQAGYSIAPISAMLGNTEKVCRTHYINFSKKKILAELQKRA